MNINVPTMSKRRRKRALHSCSVWTLTLAVITVKRKKEKANANRCLLLPALQNASRMFTSSPSSVGGLVACSCL